MEICWETLVLARVRHLNVFMHIVELVGLGDTSVEAYYRLIALFKYGMV